MMGVAQCARGCVAVLLVLAAVLPGAHAAACAGGAVPAANEAFKAADFVRCEAITVGNPSSGQTVYLLWKMSDYPTPSVTIAAQFPSDQGWVSVGLSESGSMYGSDMAVVRKVNGKEFVVEDRHAERSVTPTLDASQDVTLLAAVASSGRTSVVIKRATVTCMGTEDIDFKDVEAAAIVAWGDSHEFAYHSAGRRATAWINFLGAESAPVDLKGYKTHEVRGNSLDVPVDNTVYCYSGHQLPQDKKYHVVRAEPLLNSSHPHLVHHMILYTCLQDLDPDFLNQTTRGPPICASGMQQKGMCYSFWILWAVGGQAMQMPTEAGMPMGLPSGAADVATARNIMLEVHYDNPDKVQIRDSSGFKLYYTDELRANDAMIMTLGHLNINIPPGATSHQHTNDCSAACTSKLKKPLTALWAGLHMHSAGKAIWTDHYRGSQQLAPLGQKHSWDFNQQSPTHVKAVIQPGDRLVTNCVYNAQTRGKATRFGEGTADEMCFNFLMVYPADGISMCMDIGKVSSKADAPKLGICLDGKSVGLPNVFGALGGRNLDLATMSQIAMPFGADPISSAPYSSPACVRRSPSGADGKSSSGAQMVPGRGAMMLLTVAWLSFLWSTFC